jgi:hypothetical protein
MTTKGGTPTTESAVPEWMPIWMPGEYRAQWERNIRRWPRREAELRILRLIILREGDEIAWQVWMDVRALDPKLADAVCCDMHGFVRYLRRYLPDLGEILPVWLRY